MTVIVNAGATEVNVVNVLYENVLETGTLSWSSQADGFAASNLVDDDTWNAWKPTASGASWVKIDYGSDVTCDCAGIAAHDLATSGVTLYIQYSLDNVTFYNVAAYAPLTNEDIMIFFQAKAARYWRYYVDGPVSSTGVVKIGSALKFPCAPLSGHRPLHHSRKVTLLSNVSMAGNKLGNRPVKQEAETNVNIGQVDRAWTESDLLQFETYYNEGGGFFYCGSPVDIPRDMGFCWRPEGAGEMSITWVEGDIMSDVNFDIRAYVAT